MSAALGWPVDLMCIYLISFLGLEGVIYIGCSTHYVYLEANILYLYSNSTSQTNISRLYSIVMFKYAPTFYPHRTYLHNHKILTENP